MKPIVALMLLVAVTAPAGSAQAQAVGDASQGHELARRVCTECHVVEKSQRPSPNSQAPAFAAIAGTPGMTALALTAALRTSHRTMPNIILEDGDLRNVVAYILTLK